MYDQLDRINGISSAISAAAQAQHCFIAAAGQVAANPDDQATINRANDAYKLFALARNHVNDAIAIPLPPMDGPATTQFDRRQNQPKQAAPAAGDKTCQCGAPIKGNFNTCFACKSVPNRIPGTCPFCGEAAKPEFLSCYECKQRGATPENSPLRFTKDTQAAVPANSYNPAAVTPEVTDLDDLPW